LTIDIPKGITAMMFDRLLGFIDNSNVHAINWRDPNSDVRLATAILLFNVGPADYENLAVEGMTLAAELSDIFKIGNKRTHKLIARAAAAKNAEPTIFASAVLLKRKTDEQFRRSVIAAMQRIAMADNVLHPQEINLTQRAERLLGLESVGLN
jgi:uncharacterized tellurite resistance protein B-like protein